jgi:predicted esterase
LGLASGLEPNVQIGDFKIERRLGSGGMGVVYQALQVSLNRRVALKVLPASLAMDAAATERFHREARAAARLDHPHIVAVYTEGQEAGLCYYAMELVEGRGLDQIIKEIRSAVSGSPETGSDAGRTTTDLAEGRDAKSRPDADWAALYRSRAGADYFKTVAGLVADVADALDYAHREGVIHRDVKCSNLILAEDGRLVLTDFGIARIRHDQAVTLTGSSLGTPSYMSPEQIRHDPDRIDGRTDVYSLGVTLYELLTLEQPFSADSRDQIMVQILSQEPRRPRQVDRRIPVDLDTLCCKAMEKDPGRRYQTAGEMADDLRRVVAGHAVRARRVGWVERSIRTARRYPLSAALIAGVAVCASVAALVAWQYTRVAWAQRQAIPQIVRYVEKDRYLEAYVLAHKVQRLLPTDPMLAALWPRLSRVCSVTSEPAGAEVWLASAEGQPVNWIHLGHTPLPAVRVPLGTYVWKVTQPGCEDVLGVRSLALPSQSQEEPGVLRFVLQPKGSGPADMVWIPPSDLTQGSMFHGFTEIRGAPAFWIDRYEVTNRQFQEFVTRGGYSDPNYWTEPFVRDGQVVSWPQAIELFKDSTDIAGPAAWKHGTYPRGQEDYPVAGVSWYEAMAYARFRGKDLPTLFHWNKAVRGNNLSSRITALSNFSGAPAPVGRYPGMGEFGLYDAAGNVREWCANSLRGWEHLRVIAGGSWDDPSYSFITPGARSPWDRDLGNGIRCVLYAGGRNRVPENAFAPLEHKTRDYAHFRPAAPEVFQSYLDDLYRYDATPLNAVVETIDEDPGCCRREKITLDAAYPRERVIAYLHLPKLAAPPYQPVVWFPGGDSRFMDWDGRNPYSNELMAVLQSGRAVLLPIYKGTYQRRLADERLPSDGIQSRNLYVQMSQDLRRCVDYLQTRDDMDLSKLTYVGLSYGGLTGPIMIATEPRFKTGILLLGGVCACPRLPSADPAEFATHVKIPILMLNGRHDSIFPYETAQRPLFELLGTPEPEKRHVTLPGEHSISWEYRRLYHAQILEWLDDHLGPVTRTDRTKDSHD